MKLGLPKRNKKSVKDVLVNVRIVIRFFLINARSDVNKESSSTIINAHLARNSAINVNHKIFVFSVNPVIYLSRKSVSNPVNKDVIHAFR